MEELKPCPFCGELPQVAGGTAMHACRVLDREMRVPVAAWNLRSERTCRIVSAKEAGRTGYAPACSSCGWQSAVWHQYSYCPNCGARVEP